MRTFAPVLKVEGSVGLAKKKSVFLCLYKSAHGRIWSYVLSVHFAIFVDNNNNIQVQS